MYAYDPSKDDAEQFVRQAIVRILELRMSAGASPESLLKFAQDCAKTAAKRWRPVGSKDSGRDFHALASVLRTWHSETKYLTSDGQARPLGERGRNGLRKLVTTHFPARRYKEILAKLKYGKLIKKRGNGTWIPSESHPRVSRATTETLAHLAEGVVRLAETVCKNTQAKRKSDLLFERACKVFHLPVSEFSAFRKYVQQQGRAFIFSVDDWLERRAADSGPRKRRTCAAGAFAFGFIEDKNSKPRGRRASRQKRKVAI